MRIAFVGIERNWEDLAKRDYVFQFIKCHLELPYYYSLFGKNEVDIVTDFEWGPQTTRDGGLSCLEVILYDIFKERDYDVVVHWRKWIDTCYKSEAVNVINSQDHTYGLGWLKTVEKATEEGKLDGILCFPKWHENNLASELSRLTRAPQLLPGVTLGVDTETYHPCEKDPRALLWASDIGRGLQGAIELTLKLFQRDKRFKLHICWPDYTNGGVIIDHPALEFHKNLDNGPELWGLFNKCSFLPYTSTFKEPSSRAHRQAMAAGCIVLYPPNMGTPSDLITCGVDGIVSPVNSWIDTIIEYTEDSTAFALISDNARTYAVSENWEVQAKRFNKLFEGMINDKH